MLKLFNIYFNHNDFHYKIKYNTINKLSVNTNVSNITYVSLKVKITSLLYKLVNSIFCKNCSQNNYKIL